VNRQHKPIPRLLAALACAVLLAGCAVGPDYKPPQTPTPKAWATQAAGPESPTPASLAQWWTAFGDPVLTSLVERAVQSNLDVKLAASRVRQARAARGVAASAFGPGLNASAAYSRNQNGTASSANTYQAGFDAAWELDLFGATRRSVEAADAEITAAVENQRDALVTLAAEVARNYVELRASQQQLAIAQRNLKTQQRTLELTRQRFESGFVSGLDVADATAQVAATLAEIPQIESAARQSVYAISVLLGQPPAALLEELSAAADIPSAPPGVPAGLPSDLLRRRPDIRSAEASLHAATAQIGVATADLFPKLTLSGALGWQSDDTHSLFRESSRSWSIGPSISWPIFQSGRILSNIEVQKALQEQSFISYQQTVLNALQEVENALIASSKEQERRKALIEAAAASQKSLDLATQLYSQGQTDFLNVLVSQRSLFSAEQALVQNTKNISTNLVALYKALGGGWSETPQPVAAR